MNNPDQKDRCEKEALAVIAEVFQKMRNRATQLCKNTNVENVSVQFQPMIYPNGPVIEGYVDVVLKGGRSVTWFLDVNWTDKAWRIETYFEEKKSIDESVTTDRVIVEMDDFEKFVTALSEAQDKLLQIEPTIVSLR